MEKGLSFGISVTMPVIFTVSLLAPGCASSRATDPARTATEQFLISTAASKAVGQLTFDTLRGRQVFVDPQYFAATDQAFVLGEVRARLLMSGVQLVASRDAAQVILEVRTAGVGIDRNDYLLGIPALQVAASETAASGVPLLTPELAIAKSRYQVGVASVAYVAYWAKTGEVVASSGPFVARSVRDDWWFLGAGPNSTGDIPPVKTPGNHGDE